MNHRQVVSIVKSDRAQSSEGGRSQRFSIAQQSLLPSKAKDLTPIDDLLESVKPDQEQKLHRMIQNIQGSKHGPSKTPKNQVCGPEEDNFQLHAQVEVLSYTEKNEEQPSESIAFSNHSYQTWLNHSKYVPQLKNVQINQKFQQSINPGTSLTYSIMTSPRMANQSYEQQQQQIPMKLHTAKVSQTYRQMPNPMGGSTKDKVRDYLKTQTSFRREEANIISETLPTRGGSTGRQNSIRKQPQKVGLNKLLDGILPTVKTSSRRSKTNTAKRVSMSRQVTSNKESAVTAKKSRDTNISTSFNLKSKYEPRTTADFSYAMATRMTEDPWTIDEESKIYSQSTQPSPAPFMMAQTSREFYNNDTFYPRSSLPQQRVFNQAWVDRYFKKGIDYHDNNLAEVRRSFSKQRRNKQCGVITDFEIDTDRIRSNVSAMNSKLPFFNGIQDPDYSQMISVTPSKIASPQPKQDDSVFSKSQTKSAKIGGPKFVIKSSHQKAKSIKAVIQEREEKIKKVALLLNEANPYVGAQQEKSRALLPLKTAASRTELTFYDERKPNNALISNRMKILSQKNEEYPRMRVYNSKEVKDWSQFFDPLRSKLRVMPQERVGLFMVGKDPDFYFVKAAKQSLNNDFTHAIESLNKGLTINPTHLPCRFNHGVLMFKLGLLHKAKQDFAMVSSLNQKEFMGHFNYSLILYQLGEYEKALEPIDIIAKQSVGALNAFQNLLTQKNKEKLEGIQPKTKKERKQITQNNQYDFDLLHDAYMLKALCLSRMEDPIKSVLQILYANKFKDAKSMLKTKKKKKLTHEELLKALKNELYREIKHDVREAGMFESQKSCKSVTKLHKIPKISLVPKNLWPVTKKQWVSDKQKIKTRPRSDSFASSIQSFNIEEEIEQWKETDDAQIDRAATVTQKSSILNPIEEERKIHSIFLKNLNVKTIFDNKVKSSSNSPIKIQMGDYTINEPKTSVPTNMSREVTNENQIHEKASTFKLPLKQMLQRTMTSIINQDPKSREQPYESFRSQTQKSIESKKEDKEAKKKSGSQIGSIMSSFLKNSVVNSQLSHYKQKQPQINATMVIAKMKAGLLSQHKDMLDQQIQKKEDLLQNIEDKFYGGLLEAQVKIIDAGCYDLRFYSLYAHMLKPAVKEFEALKRQIQDNVDLNINEKMTILKRAQITHQHDNPDPTDPLYVGDQDDDIDQEAAQEKMLIFNQKMGNDAGTQKEHVLDRDLSGVNFKQNSIDTINKDQKQLNVMMEKVEKQFEIISKELNEEMKNHQRKIFNSTLLDHANKIVLSENVDEFTKLNKELMSVLKQSLESKTEVPDGVLNTLRHHLDERDKAKEKKAILKLSKEQGIKTSVNNRITTKQAQLINREFTYKTGKNRNCKNLSILMGKLSFFKKFDLTRRQLICQHVDYLKIPARTVLFKQGDLEDYQYVIVKGRVALDIQKPDLGNLPVVIALLDDGERVGNLTMGKGTNNFQARRGTTCTTVEDTDFLMISRGIANLINMFPVPTHLQELTSDALTTRMRVAYLEKNIPQFKYIENNDFITSIAKKIKVLNFQMGQEIIEEQKVPTGLYIIMKGHCRVILKNIAERRLFDNRNVTHKHMNKKPENSAKKPLAIRNEDMVFEDFNPDNTMLKQINFNQRNFQNARIMIDENGKEIKNKIVYNDQLLFKQIMPGMTFGGRTLIQFDSFKQIKAQLGGVNSVRRTYPLGWTPQQIKAAQDKETLETNLMKSLLTIVADSANVEVWFIDKQMIDQSMVDIPVPFSDNEQRMFGENIVRSTEEDRQNYRDQDIEFIRDQFHKWERFKQEQVETLFETAAYAKYMKNGKPI